MIKISHEVPLDLLEQSRWFNDFDYALVHLLDKYPKYFEFYKQSLELGRDVVLTNTLHEFGEPLTMAEYAMWIEKLHPTYYIVPNKLWDSDETIEMAVKWMNEYGNKLPQDIKRIGVAQGEFYQDISYTYKFMDTMCDKIAFTFQFHPDLVKRVKNTIKFDKTTQNHIYVRNSKEIKFNEEMSDTDVQALIRYIVLKELSIDKTINTRKEHHLLGIQNTSFLHEACKFPWITSINTSNPIVYGYLGKQYETCETFYDDVTNHHTGNAGIEKSKIRLQDIFSEPLKDRGNLWQNLEKIKQNVSAFKDIIKDC